MAWKGIVNQFVDIDGFQNHVDALQFNGWTPSFVVAHNTSAPNTVQWRDWWTRPRSEAERKPGDRRPVWSPAQWGRNLESYYRNQSPPWSGGPHAFVTENGILLFTPFTLPGTHSPAWNDRTWGIETVGEFESESFDNPIRSNLVAVLGILHARIGLIPDDYHLGVRGLHFHKEDPKTTHKSCPGHNIIKPDLVADVAAYMHGANAGDHRHISPAVHEAPTQAMSAEEMNSPGWLQASLVQLGASLTVDGQLGPQTRAAVVQFQQRHQLAADGIAGPLTRLAIKQALAA